MCQTFSFTNKKKKKKNIRHLKIVVQLLYKHVDKLNNISLFIFYLICVFSVFLLSSFFVIIKRIMIGYPAYPLSDITHA